MKTLYLLVGPPGSGKSTWTAAFLADNRATVISSDNIIESRAAEMGLTYSEAWGRVDMADIETEVRDAFKNAYMRNENIIVDRTNMRIKSRTSFISQISRKKYRVVAVVFSVPRDELDRRLESRAQNTGKIIPAAVVDQMLENYQEPTLDEVDEIIKVEFE